MICLFQSKLSTLLSEAQHHLHRLFFEDLHTIQLSEVAEHDQKAQVVIEGAHHSSSHLQGHIHSAACRQHLRQFEPYGFLVLIVLQVQIKTNIP